MTGTSEVGETLRRTRVHLPLRLTAGTNVFSLTTLDFSLPLSVVRLIAVRGLCMGGGRKCL